MAMENKNRNYQGGIMKIVLIILSLVLISCADPEERLDVGASDGYAVGFNSTCKIRSTLIDGDFDNKDYKRGYESGYREGVIACREWQKKEE